MNYFGIDPDVAYSGATAMSGETASATAAARSALAALFESGGVVVHPVLSAAFHSVGDEHAGLHHSIGPSVQELANSIAGGTKTIVDAQNESSAVQRRSYASGEATVSATAGAIVA